MTDFERTFDLAAHDYDRLRPICPKELHSDIFSYSRVDSGSYVLDIGLGSGLATKPFLDTGCSLVGIEPGANLLSLAKERFKDFPNFIPQNLTLQDYSCQSEKFDLIYAATAFHWIPEEYGSYFRHIQKVRLYESGVQTLLQHQGLHRR